MAMTDATRTSKEQALQQRVRDSGTLLERLQDSRRRIAKMCSERRGPRMSIPVEWSDDDFFICLTLEDAIAAYSAPEPSTTDSDDINPQAVIHALRERASNDTAPGGGDIASIIHRLRFKWADNGAGYNTEFTADMHAAADELEEREQSFALRHDADMRAIKRWQEAHPGNDLVWPDHADMCVWLLGEIERLRRDIQVRDERMAELEAGCAEFVRCQRELCSLIGAPTDTDSMAMHDAIKARLSQPPSRSITLSVRALRDVLEFIDPDNDPDVQDSEGVIEWMPERTSVDGEPMAAGYYAYIAEYPEEGVHGPLGESAAQDEQSKDSQPPTGLQCTSACCGHICDSFSEQPSGDRGTASVYCATCGHTRECHEPIEASQPPAGEPGPLLMFTEWAAGARCDDEHAPAMVRHISDNAKAALAGYPEQELRDAVEKMQASEQATGNCGPVNDIALNSESQQAGYPSLEIRQLFNKAIGVQNGSQFRFSFETDEEANRAFEFIAMLGNLELGDAAESEGQP